MLVRRAWYLVPGASCMVRGAGPRASCIVLCFLLCLALPATAQMPDPRQMHGRVIPAGELPAGGVTVRVVREMVGNNVAGVDVELHGAGDVRQSTTGQDGRAQFAGVPVGSRVRAVAVVDGERLESSAFAVPASGGVRTILVAGLGLGSGGAGQSAGAAASAAPGPATGSPADLARLLFGNNTRIAIEFQDDTLAVFYLLDLVNPTGVAVPLAAPLELVLPEEASGASTLEGASPLVSVNGGRVSIAGPIPPGITAVTVAYRLEAWNPRQEIAQAFPLRIDQLAVAVQRLTGLTVDSPQAPSIREASLGGHAFLIASGPALPAGAPLGLTLGGLPHRSPWPRYLALGLAALIAVLGVWLARTPAAARAEGRRASLEKRRARGLEALAALDADHTGGRIGAADYEQRRGRLLGDLERTYAALETERMPPGGGRGKAA